MDNDRYNDAPPPRQRRQSGGAGSFVVGLIVLILVAFAGWALWKALKPDTQQESSFSDNTPYIDPPPAVPDLQGGIQDEVDEDALRAEEPADPPSDESSDSDSDGSVYRGEFRVMEAASGPPKVCRSDIWVHIGQDEDARLNDEQRRHIQDLTLEYFCRNPNQRLPTDPWITDVNTDSGVVRVRHWIEGEP